jgi:AbrB family looped-hinge helix DNA binding protein
MMASIQGWYAMERVKVSPKFQIVIPKKIRERMKLKPGQTLTLMESEGMLKAVPDVPLEKLRGILRGISTEGLREKKDRIP